MRIECSERNLKDLLSAINFTTSLLEYTNDFVDSPQVAMRLRVWRTLEQSLLQVAHEHGMTDVVESDGDGLRLAHTITEHNMDVLSEYDQLVINQELAAALARRDFTEHFTESEIEKMVQTSEGYLGHALHSFEEQYWNEFAEHGYYRLRIEGQGK